MGRQRPETERFLVAASAVHGVYSVDASSTKTFGRHTHDEFGVGIFVDGTHDTASGRGDLRAYQGDVVTVNPNEVHDGRAVGGRMRRWRMLYFDRGIIGDAAELLGLSRGTELHYPVLQEARVASDLVKLQRMLSATGPTFCHDDFQLLLLSVLAPLMSVSVVPSRRPTSRLLMVKDMIDQAPEEAMSLSEMADEADVDRFQFLRAFKAHTGLTPQAYRLQKQLQKAHKLVRGGHALASVAFDSGFADQPHMTRNFTRFYGLTPAMLARGFLNESK